MLSRKANLHWKAVCPCIRMESVARLPSQMSRPALKDVGRTDYGELFGLPVRPRSRRTSVFIQGSWTICARRWLCRRGTASLWGIHLPWEQYSGPASDCISKCLKDKAVVFHPDSLSLEAVIYSTLLKLEVRWNVLLSKDAFVYLAMSENTQVEWSQGKRCPKGLQCFNIVFYSIYVSRVSFKYQLKV